MTPRSKLDRAEPAAADKTGLPVLAPREREVALALAEFKTYNTTFDGTTLHIYN